MSSDLFRYMHRAPTVSRRAFLDTGLKGLGALLALSPGVFAATGHNAATQPSGLRVFLWDAETVEKARSNPTAYGPALDRLRRGVDRALELAPVSVMDKEAVPPSGDKHDYMSQGPYWWPNPDTPDGLPYVRRDGEHNPERNALDRVPLGRMCRGAENLATAWFFLGDDRYAQHAARLLRTWFLNPATRMNPHLEYGQRIPGICDGRGIGIIDTSGSFPPLVDALGLLDASDIWTEADARGMRDWMGRYLTWLLESDKGKDEAATGNNHAIYYDAQAMSLALYTDRPENARRIALAVPKARIASQIEPDGAQPRELERTNSRGYSLMNTRGFINLAILAGRVGENLWNYETPDGRGIRKAIDWFIPYVRGEKEWTWKQIGRFSERRYASLFWYAAVAYGDPRYKALLDAVASERLASSRMHLTWPAPG